MFQLTFLGTSAGMPTKQRNVTALAVVCVNTCQSDTRQKSKSNRPWVLVDCGEGTQHQLLHTKLSVNQLAAICITHVHGDHCYGLSGLLASMAMLGRKEPLKIIGPAAIKQLLDVVKVTTDLTLSFAIEFIEIEEVLSNQHSDNRICITLSNTHTLDIGMIKLSHRVPSHAFSLTQSLSNIRLDIDKLKPEGIAPSSAWHMLQQGKDVTVENGEVLKSIDYTIRYNDCVKIIVAGDNDSPKLLSHITHDAHLLVHEATYTQAVADKIKSRPDGFDPMHTTAHEIAKFADAVDLPNLILTHFSARYQPFDNPSAKVSNMSDIRLEAEQYYHGNLWLARDFSQFNVSAGGVTALPAA